MGRALTSGSSLSHYRIISPLGAGGMGEVYLAQDLTLERSVALKILPPAVVRNEERVRRFIQEAKAASALNHPHIVTIYEIGQGEPRLEGDSTPTATTEEGAPASIHYIAMEFVGGDTLGHAIHHEQTDLRVLLGYLAQVADGLAKAHSAGIVHRDLKPDNIMIAKDGYAKVLDFGLAKLTERQEPSDDETNMATQTRAKTMEGVVMGTTGYMSPEQVQGKAVDHRSDIFSFGCILYEAATRRRPFAADSSIEVMHKVLAEKPAPVEELNPEVPGELRRLIRRCLAKAPEQRLQSMKDLAIELHEIVDEFESLSLSSVTRTSGPSTNIAAAPIRRSPAVRLGMAAALVGIAGIAFGIWGLTHWRKAAETRRDSFQSMQMTRFTTNGKVFGASISADGRYMAQGVYDQGRWSLWVKQVETGSEVQIVPPQETPIDRINFSPDGNYVFYLGRDREATLYSVLFQVPSLGGTPRQILFDIDTAVTFSPDGKQVAFIRGYPHIGESALMVANADGSSERKLAVLQRPLTFPNISCSWSPDGRHIAAAVGQGVDFAFNLVSTADGKMTPLGSSRWFTTPGFAWLPDGRGLIAAGRRRGGGGASVQIWQIDYPSGETRRITNDLNDYGGVSITADGRRIATVQFSRIANLWVAPAADPSAAKQITFGTTREDAIDWFDLTRDGTYIFAARADRFRHIYALDRDGSGRRPLTTGPTLNFAPRVTRDGNTVVFTSLREGETPHLWKLDASGGSLSQLTHGIGETTASVDPLGRWAFFTRVDSASVLWKVPLAGGEPERVADAMLDWVGVSPDGQRLAYAVFRQESGRVFSDIAVTPVAGGKPLVTLPMPADAVAIEWAPSGDALDYVQVVDGKWNLWRQPLAGGEAKRLTDFQSLQIYSFHWSADGTQLILARGEDTNDVVLISDFR